MKSDRLSDALLTMSAQNRELLTRYLEPLSAEVRESVLDQLQANYQDLFEPTPPAVGDLAPSFALCDRSNNLRALDHIDRVTVLSFYRGGWCTQCTAALRALQRRLPAIEMLGGQVWAISPDPAQAARKTAQSNTLKFPLLSDPDNTVSDAYGLRMSIAPLLTPIYKEHAIPWPANCDQLDVPYPATIIVDANRIVRRVFVNKDPAKRMTPEDIAGEVRQLSQHS